LDWMIEIPMTDANLDGAVDDLDQEAMAKKRKMRHP